ncbi:hypothetical protein OF83DRAFT_1175370 [Amylostereum chailletii]|nr:hypothetical protein OF83DRAFT_1175370 [Amylostereum chailletii]
MYSSSQSSKRASTAYSSSTWSANSASTSATTPATVAMTWSPHTPTNQLPMTPPSSGGPSSRTYTTYGVPGTPGAPMMNTVPLPPASHHNLPTPPSSPQASRLNRLLDPPTCLTFDVRYGLRPQAEETQRYLNSYALSPPQPRMLLIVGQSWQIDVQNPAGVTAIDVCNQLFYFLQHGANSGEYQSYPLSAQRAASGSVRRCDMLSRCTFAGLSPSGDGRWYVNLV